VHGLNLDRLGDMIDLAVSLGADRLEVAHVQYHGWALRNRAVLMPTREQVDCSVDLVSAARERLRGILAIDFVVPDYYAVLPKACMGGWGRRYLVVTPSGQILPCHAAPSIPDLVFASVRERSLRDTWCHDAAFGAFRGTSWMKEPCRSCPRQHVDFGGCRCQALALTGDARNADPVCEKSASHWMLAELIDRDGDVDKQVRTQRIHFVTSSTPPQPGRRAASTGGIELRTTEPSKVRSAGAPQRANFAPRAKSYPMARDGLTWQARVVICFGLGLEDVRGDTLLSHMPGKRPKKIGLRQRHGAKFRQQSDKRFKPDPKAERND
jgi:radical SAM protein with 4Fe4S-binding SPASM domain